MFDRIKNISHSIQLKLENTSYMTDLKKHMKSPDEWVEYNFKSDLRTVKNPPDDSEWSEESKANVKRVENHIFPYYLHLLAIACTYHMREELDEIFTAGKYFSVNIHADINDLATERSLVRRPLVDQPLTACRHTGSPDTLLGIASFHGYLDLVKYLVEEKKSDVNACSIEGNTPLHKVVKGDSHPINNHSYGTQHAEIAQYLIDHKANMAAKNNEARTPLEEAKRAKPHLISLLFSNTVRKDYFADTVRPILEKAKKSPSLIPELKSDASESKEEKKESILTFN